jgi:6-phosphogluconolactonase
MTAFAAPMPQAPAPGRLVFIGTYTNARSQGIYAFRFDDRTGALTPLGLAAATPNPSFLTASADGRFLFAVNEGSSYGGERSGSVTSFAVDRATGKLTQLSVQASKGTDPCHLVLDRTGRFLAVANYSSGSFAVFPVAADGRLGAAVTVIQREGRGPNSPRQDGPHAHQVSFSTDNRFMIGVDLGTDTLAVYRFDAATGALTPNDPAGLVVTPGIGPRHIAFHPDGKRAFVISELGSTIESLAWDGAAGVLRAAGGSVSTLPGDFHGQSATAEIEVHPNGRFVYGSNRGHDSLAIFSIAGDGALTPVGFEPTRGRTPRHFAIAPGGRWLVAANQDTGTLAVFRIDTSTGALTPTGPLVEAGTPVCVLFQ